MRESNAREIAAQMLQTAICDALCSSDEFLSSSAREWLHLENLPTESQIWQWWGWIFRMVEEDVVKTKEELEELLKDIPVLSIEELTKLLQIK